ncbi:MAG: hypothetical protein KGI89_14300, partial [Euryarchaeota archaeon]|nr:hypothetical protein [Euryarchaeota archaeon]
LPAGGGSLASDVVVSGTGGAGSFVWFPPTAPGSWTATYTASAPGHPTVRGSVVLTVTGTAKSGKGWFSGPTLDAVVIGGIVGAALLVFFLLGQLRWRRRTRPAPRVTRRRRERRTRGGPGTEPTVESSGSESPPPPSPEPPTPPPLPGGPEPAAEPPK